MLRCVARESSEPRVPGAAKSKNHVFHLENDSWTQRKKISMGKDVTANVKYEFRNARKWPGY